MAELIHSSDESSWMEAIDCVGRHDIYHLPNYQRIPTTNQQQEAFLVVATHNTATAALPLLVRPVSQVPGLEGRTEYDAVSAYGYPGAISSTDRPSHGLATAFRTALSSALADLGVVSLFVRQNPFFATEWLFADYATIVDLGRTVFVDLSPNEDILERRASNNHRRSLKKTAALDPVLKFDPSFESLDRFMYLYRATMLRNNAKPRYLFPTNYYRALRAELTDSVVMFHAEIDGTIVSSAIVFIYGTVVHYHLGGTDPSWVSQSVSRWLLEQIRKWSKARGSKQFHLGGGVSSKEDSLFRFKSGFAKEFRQVRVVQCVRNPEAYRALVDCRTSLCQGRSKIRPRWRSKTRPSGRGSKFLTAASRGGVRKWEGPCVGGPSCCVRGDSCRR